MSWRMDGPENSSKNRVILKIVRKIRIDDNTFLN